LSQPATSDFAQNLPLLGGERSAFIVARGARNKIPVLCVLIAMSMSTILIKRAQAKRRWLADWNAWAATNISSHCRATEKDAFGFYMSRKNAPGLGVNGERAIPWNSVHGWLLESGKLAR
jgi:hypothetical protein